MKNRILRILAVVTACWLLLSCVSTSVAAETQTSELFTLEAERNMGIAVTYTAEPPAVEFIAPNGDIYGADAIQSGKMTCTDSGDALFFRIPNADAGTWQIRYDKKSNPEIEVNYAPYAESLAIQKFKFSQTDESTLQVSFTANHSENMRYEYKIYAALTENGSVIGQKEIGSGSATANQSYETSVSLRALSSYGNYQLYLEVTGQDNGLEVFDNMVADGTFSYTNPDAPAAPDNFYTQYNVADDSLRIDWSQTSAHRCDTLVAVYYDDATSPAYYSTFDTSVSVTELVTEETAKTIRVDLSYKNYRGVYSQIASRTIDVAMAKAVSLSGADITTSAQAQIVYDLSGLEGGPFKAQLQVNDKPVQELSLQGKNSFAIQLESFNNTVSLVWYYNEFTAFKVSGDIYSDRLAPSLSIPDAGDIIKTDKGTYVLTGTVDAGCTVTVNGDKIKVDKNGIFTEKLKLKAGENVFTVIATGPNGNHTQQTFTVEYVLPGVLPTSGPWAVALQYAPLAASALVALALGLFILRSRVLYQRRRENSVWAARMLLLRDCSIFLMGLAIAATAAMGGLLAATISKINSVAFYDVAVKEGVKGAYALLQLRHTYLIWTIVTGAVVLVAIGLWVLFAILAKKPPKEKPPKPPKAPKAPRAPLFPKAPNTPAAHAAPTRGHFCGACGTENKPGAKFCKGCGASLTPKN